MGQLVAVVKLLRMVMKQTGDRPAYNECACVCRDCTEETVIFLMILIQSIQTNASIH